MELVQETPYRFRLPRSGDMRVPGIVLASEALLGDATSASQPLEQVANVAALPGIVGASYAMPDMHRGYGFPIGGVGATDVRDGGVVSPGGVGFDISCGVRLLTANMERDEFPRARERIMDGLDQAIPRGAGRGAVWSLAGPDDLERLLRTGVRYAIECGYGVERDLERCEDAEAVADVDPAAVSTRAMDRGLGQVGSLGSGNHFAEVQAVEEIRDDEVAGMFGLGSGQVCLMIHCGSRGLGHQVCTDHVRTMEKSMSWHGIRVPDRQLACAPVESAEARSYLAAMHAAASYARANRQVLGDAAARVFREVTGHGLDLVYDISHNLAKLEEHEVDGSRRTLCVHRKGATRALPPGNEELPVELRNAGQPVLVPGSMGSASYVLAGVAGNTAFASTCHGAGRSQSRHQAARSIGGKQLRRHLESQNIAVRGKSPRGLAEETPFAYKDVSEVVTAAEKAGLCRIIARLVPLGVVKG